MIKRCALALLFMLGATASFAGERLEPEISNFDSYDKAVARVFKSAFTPDVRARAIVEPAMFLEFAVGAKENDGAYRVFLLEPSWQVWDAITSPTPKFRPADITVEECDIPIYREMGEHIVAARKARLQQVQRRPESAGLDGEIYHFSMPVDGKELSGQTWSPPQGSEAGMMAQIAYAIHDACKNKSKHKLAVIKELTEALLKEAQ